MTNYQFNKKCTKDEGLRLKVLKMVTDFIEINGCTCTVLHRIIYSKDVESSLISFLFFFFFHGTGV